jgi:nicotinamide phosphoribosyltransferase
MSIIYSSDSYKYSHHLFSDPGIIEMYDYLESRGGMFQDTTNFGMQAVLETTLCGCVVTPDDVEEARKFFKAHFGRDDVFQYDDWMYIAKDLKGRLPIEISTLPEGMTVPVRTPLLTYINTDPKCSWLSGFLEPALLQLWYPITVCTLSRHIKQMLYQFFVETGTVENVSFALTDFAVRGSTGMEAARLGGAAHLVNFVGSDNVPAVRYVRQRYAMPDLSYMPGFGVRATEHSVMTQKGREGEASIVGDILRTCPDGIVAMVADSYNVFDFAEKILGEQFHTEVVSHDGIVVVRPDSGEPIPTMMKLLWILGEKFGWTVNEKGYRVLNHVRTLQGDKNDYDAIYNMARALKGGKWSLDNIATFGMGGALLQGSNRDTQKMAVKLSSLTDASGLWHDIYKDPITDPGKGSKFGRFVVVEEFDEVLGKKQFVTKTLKQGQPIPEGNLLRPIFRNGEMLIHDDFETVRARANEWMTTGESK